MNGSGKYMNACKKQNSEDGNGDVSMYHRHMLAHFRGTMHPMRQGILVFAHIALLLVPRTVFGGETSRFVDLPRAHPAFAEIEFLAERGIIQGNPDGTFHPDELVSRAAALKMIIAPIAPLEELWKNERSSYKDVSNLDWFFPYIEYAFANLHVIDGPPVTSIFVPGRTVIKAEFLKMLFLADQAPIEEFTTIRAPFAPDAINMEEWYIPYLKYAVSASLIPFVGDGNGEPAQELTRADAAVLVARYIQYKEGGRTQELVQQTENALVRTLEKLGIDDIRGASLHSVRALLTSYGASKIHPLDPLVQGMVKIAEGFWFLLLSWHQVEIREWQGALQNILTAATRAEQARSIHGDLDSLALKLEKLAEAIAIEAHTGFMGGR